MHRWQNLLVLLATVFAALALLPLESRVRLLSSILAAALVCIMLTIRLRAHRVRKHVAHVEDTYARIERIRAQRAGSRRPGRR